MDKIKLVLVGIIIVLFILPNLANASVDEYKVGKDNMNQPKTLNDAVDEIKQMIKDNRPRWEIAKRVGTIADNQIRNANDVEALEVSKWNMINWALREYLEIEFDQSDEERKFREFRDKYPAGPPYDVSAKWVWKSRYGQCEENSALVYYLLKEAGEEDIRIFKSARKDHQYVVWGLGCEKDPDNPESWTEDVIIPDSWQHKVLRSQAVLNNEYCAVGEEGYNIDDQTYNRDTTACGFVRNKCCKKIAPCRGEPDRVCRDDECYICGREGDYCCKDERCNEGLKCKDGKCVEKCEEEEEVFPDCPPCVGSGSGLQLDAGNSSCTVNGENFSVRCMYRGSSHDLLEDETSFDDPHSAPDLQSEHIPDLSRAQDSLGNEQFVDRGHIYITTRDAAEKGEVNIDICNNPRLYRAGEEITSSSAPSVQHVTVTAGFLYRERYYIDVKVDVFDSPQEAVRATFDALVECAKAVVNEREDVD